MSSGLKRIIENHDKSLEEPSQADFMRISEHRDRPFRLIVTGHFANA
ncbi:hypothetical protein [Pseudomonas aeruginosa]|nr:hypothetical protein [Pseudomonas aeruginosa]